MILALAFTTGFVTIAAMNLSTIIQAHRDALRARITVEVIEELRRRDLEVWPNPYEDWARRSIRP